ncbi:MAG: ribonuclease H-like domain-containing protein [Fuerstiella sp.]|nr:ribonuclease H-like domain-containing protein [Fuerstiella sp.]
MITESLRHCRGIGPSKLDQLHNVGICSWHDVIEHSAKIPQGIRSNLLEEARRSLEALDQQNIGYFTDRLCPQDKWRILAEFFDQTSFFDIETTGLGIDAAITVIVCWHQDQLHTFVEHENLDEFLDLLDDISLLASFNGAGFDVPRVLDAFHIPGLPCPHLDLRWPCYHAGMTGGLKEIERHLQMARPSDLMNTDGELAVALWSAWRDRKDSSARQHLIRYCSADVLALIILAQHLGNVERYNQEELWSHLPAAEEPVTGHTAIDRTALTASLFGSASPSKLRIRR